MSFQTHQTSPDPNITPSVYTGTAAPNTTPLKIGDIFVDTNAAKVYVAAGTSASSDWKVLN